MSTTKSTPPPWRVRRRPRYAALPENHRFQIPEDAHWRGLRAVATNVGRPSRRRCARSRRPTRLFRHLRWRRPVDQQGAPAGRDLEGPHRALLDPDAILASVPEDESGRGLRVPHQEVRR